MKNPEDEIFDAAKQVVGVDTLLLSVCSLLVILIREVRDLREAR